MYQQIQAEVEQGHRHVRALCAVLELSRAGYYRHRQRPKTKTDEEVALQDQIQQIALEMGFYGYRRVRAALQQEGWRVNGKRVLRLMREDNLLCLRQRKWIRTTDSSHCLPVYSNLLPELVLTGINQLWVADITYIRLRWEFIYLALILDVFSRCSVGWQLGRRLDTELALAALQMALSGRQVQPGLVHHSDRGVQYASHAYTERLQQHGIRISMSRPGNPYDNAYAESFIKTLKQEEVYRYEYRTLEEAQERITWFLRDVYNQKRLHSALRYQSPAQFEARLEQPTSIMEPSL
jgi:transposase InsO family protein